MERIQVWASKSYIFSAAVKHNFKLNSLRYNKQYTCRIFLLKKNLNGSSEFYYSIWFRRKILVNIRSEITDIVLNNVNCSLKDILKFV